ncbi:MAG: hypothetical protein GY941_04910 [Planctomycetes bacterium]|nr:hypothetical protein [Planctomycetota bacterium]
MTKKSQDLKIQHLLKRQGQAATLLTQLVDRTMKEKEEATVCIPQKGYVFSEAWCT